MVNNPCAAKEISYLPPYDAVIQRRQHAVAPLRGFHSQPIPVVRFCALSNPYGYYRRYALLPSWFSRIHLPTSLPSARLCFPCLPRVTPQRYYGDSDSCSAHLRRRPPHLSRHIFLSFRLQPRVLTGHRLPTRQRDQRFSDFAMYEQAGRSTPAESSSFTYGPTIRLRLLPTLLRSHAVTFGYGVVAFSGMDFHHAIVAPSWAHSFPHAFSGNPGETGTGPPIRTFGGDGLGSRISSPQPQFSKERRRDGLRKQNCRLNSPLKISLCLSSATYNPVLLARQLTTLDILSAGRLRVGFGIGWSPDEYEAAGVTWHERGKRADELIKALKKIWTTDPVDFQGKYYRIPKSLIGPKPIQKPHPPIYMAAFTPSALKRVATKANGWFPVGIPLSGVGPMFDGIKGMAKDAGRDPSALELIVRANVEIQNTPIEKDRADFTGTLEQIAEDVTTG